MPGNISITLLTELVFVIHFLSRRRGGGGVGKKMKRSGVYKTRNWAKRTGLRNGYKFGKIRRKMSRAEVLKN